MLESSLKTAVVRKNCRVKSQGIKVQFLFFRQFPFFPIQTKMSLHYIKASAVRKFVKTYGKRVSKEFLESLDRLVEKKLSQASTEHNGGKKTLDSAVAGYILGNK